MSSKRPSMSRGLTFPIYTSPSNLVDSTISSLASLNIHTEDSRSSIAPLSTTESPSPLPPQPRDTSLSSSSSSPASYPTPPDGPTATTTTTSMSQTTTPQSPHHHHHHHHHHSASASYFPPYASSSSSSSSPRYRIPSASNSPAVSPGIPLSTSSGTRSVSTTYPSSSSSPSTLPLITSPPSVNATFRGYSDSRNRTNVAMSIDSTPTHHILKAPLGDGFSADSITIAARKENILVIIADRWDQEQDCHNEWHVQFGRDSDMSNIHANFDNGVLRITVKRFQSTRP